MNALTNAVDWFAGGEQQYMTLLHCMNHDYFWVGVTVVLDLAIAAGYGLIAMHWWRNQKLLPPSPAKRALGNMRNIFLFCGICGYLFIPIKMIWPAWRLYDLFMAVLVYFTWRYAWGARDLRVVYSELGRTSQLAADLQQMRRESRQKAFFLNAISHDLRTPLNGVVLHAALAEMFAKADDREGMREALGEVKSSAHAVAALLDRFLDFARMTGAEVGTDDVMTFSVGEAVADVVRTFEATAREKHLELRFDSPADLFIRCDRTRFARVLANLVDNAVRFTERGGVRVLVEADGSGLGVHVIDTGIGIDPADQGRLFEEFFQAHNHERDRSKGFGLGLAIARRLAEQMGGGIAVESAPGAGSRFTFALPAGVVTGRPRRPAPEAPAGSAVPAR